MLKTIIVCDTCGAEDARSVCLSAPSAGRIRRDLCGPCELDVIEAVRDFAALRRRLVRPVEEHAARSEREAAACRERAERLQRELARARLCASEALADPGRNLQEALRDVVTNGRRQV